MIDVARLLGSTAMAERPYFATCKSVGTEKLNAPFSWDLGSKPLSAAPTPEVGPKAAAR
jgi:hypothetical protein